MTDDDHMLALVARLRGRGYRGQWWRNLSHRPARPAADSGRVQVRARRALRVLGTASTTEVLRWTHRSATPRRRDYTRRVLQRIGVRVGRASGRGREWRWKLPEEANR